MSILFDLLVEEVGLVGLDLQFNQITEGCGKKSITLLKTNRDLCILDLRNNELGNLLIDLEKQTLNKLSQYLAINEKLRTVANPIPDPDLEWLDAKDPFKNDKVGKSRVLQQTRSSVGKLSSSSNPNISACSSKIDTGLVALKAMARNTSTSRPKSTITNTLKSKPNASQSKAPRKTFAPRIKPTVPKTNTSKLATEVKKIKSTNISNSDRLYQAKDIQKARHDPQEIEMVLRALDDYHKRTGVTGIHKLSEKSTIISPTGSNQISQSAKHNHISSDHSESALKDENYVLKKRVDALEKLFKSFMASLPVVGDIHSIAPPQTDIFAQRISTSTRSVHFDQNNDVTKQGHYNIAPNQSQKPIGESFNDFNDYSPSNHTVQHYFKVANLPPLASTFDFSNQQFNNLITNPVKTDIMEIKGALQKPPSSLEDMIKLLENSLEGFHKVLDKLEAGVAKG